MMARWKHDTEAVARAAELKEQFGDSALSIAVDRWIVSEKALKQAQDALRKLDRKIDHGCTDAYCKECDG